MHFGNDAGLPHDQWTGVTALTFFFQLLKDVWRSRGYCQVRRETVRLHEFIVRLVLILWELAGSVCQIDNRREEHAGSIRAPAIEAGRWSCS